MIEIPGYRIVRTLGKGGMASVYLAIQENFEREVALKVMNASLSEDDKFTERFLREAKIVSQLVHPNIVTVYDVGVHNHLHYLSMEYIPGMDLKQKRKQLNLRESLQVIKDVAKALDYASKKGYVHRDVKPENIMLNEDDGRAVLMDFGIACMSDSTSGMTQTGTAIGTPHYMSPEQAKGRPVDSRSDLYSLGVVLFLLAAGHVPYDADSAVAVGIKHVSEEIPRLPKNLSVLQAIIDKILAKDPAERFQTGLELINAIDQITPEDIAAIEALANRHYTTQVDTRDTEAPTLVSASVSAVQSPRSNPDRTTLATSALNTQPKADAITGQTRAITSGVNLTTATTNSGKVISVDHNVVANRVPTRTGNTNADQVRAQTERSKAKRGNAVSNGASNTANHRIANTGSTTSGAKATASSGAQRRTPSGKMAATGANQRATEEIVSIDFEDRREMEAEKGRSWGWAIAALLLVAVGAGAVMFKAQLPPPLPSYVDLAITKSLDVRDELYASLGRVPPPRETMAITTMPDDEQAADATKNSAPDTQSELLPPANVVADETSTGAIASSQNALTQPLPDLMPGAGLVNEDGTQQQVAPELATSALAISEQATSEQATQELANPELANPELGTQNDVRSLREELARDLSVAPQLAQMYRDVLISTPGDKKAEWGLKELKDYLYRYIREGLAERDLTKTQQYITAVQTSFPDIASDEKYQEFRTRFAAAEEAQEFIDSGNTFLAANKLTSPSNGNALQAFNKALAIDDGNPLAKAGLAKIADRYHELAADEVAKSQWNAAMEMINRGLALNSDHKALAAMQQQVGAQVERQKNIATLLAQANTQIIEGNLISPFDESAYHRYQQVLNIDRDNAQARQGLVTVEQQLAYRVEEAINRSEFTVARSELSAARERYSSSERFLALSASLEAAVAADYLARQPKITDVLVSNHLPETIAESQAGTLTVDRTLYIGFQYDNLEADTNIVKAVLYDGSRSVEIAQVPVIVSGKNGVKFFSIDRPVDGFSAGGYTLDLLLGDNRLSTLAFKVENSRSGE